MASARNGKVPSGTKSGFTKGMAKLGGRQAGTPNKVTQEVQAVAREIVENADYRRNLMIAAIERTLSPAMEALLWSYAYGKPKETVEHQIPLPIRIVIKTRNGQDRA